MDGWKGVWADEHKNEVCLKVRCMNNGCLMRSQLKAFVLRVLSAWLFSKTLPQFSFFISFGSD